MQQNFCWDDANFFFTRELEAKHTWIGDHMFCPKTGELHLIGVYTSGKICPGCREEIEKLETASINIVEFDGQGIC